MNSSLWAWALVGSALMVMPRRVEAQSACDAQLGTLQQDLHAFDGAARQFGPPFPRADAEEAAVGAARQGLGGDIHDRLARWNDRIQSWADGVAGYRQCLGDRGCDLGNFINGQQTKNPDLAQWLRSIANNGLESATQTADRAAHALVDYTAGSGGRMIGSIAKALSCTANPPPPATPRAPARVPPLPPDTVNQTGLEWEPKIGACTGKGPFRFSLCERRYLDAGEISRPCSPSLVSGVTGGHNANYVFSPGHGQFLPKGMNLDGNGILQGDSCKLLRMGTRLPLCVRQLDVERCDSYQVDGKMATNPAAKPGGHAAIAVLGIAAAAGGVALGASALKSAADLSTSTTTSTGSSYNGTYDFTFVFTNPPPTPDTQKTLSRFFIVSNGAISSSDGTLRGSLSSAGAASFVAPCPINNDSADFVGNLTTSGTGSGTYRCRTGGTSRTWSVSNRR